MTGKSSLVMLVKDHFYEMTSNVKRLILIVNQRCSSCSSTPLLVIQYERAKNHAVSMAYFFSSSRHARHPTGEPPAYERRGLYPVGSGQAHRQKNRNAQPIRPHGDRGLNDDRMV